VPLPFFPKKNDKLFSNSPSEHLSLTPLLPPPFAWCDRATPIPRWVRVFLASGLFFDLVITKLGSCVTFPSGHLVPLFGRCPPASFFSSLCFFFFRSKSAAQNAVRGNDSRLFRPPRTLLLSTFCWPNDAPLNVPLLFLFLAGPLFPSAENQTFF